MSRKKQNKKIEKIIISIIVLLIFVVGSYFGININIDTGTISSNSPKNITPTYSSYTLDKIPEYNGNPYVEIDNNIPSFTEEDYGLGVFENYSELDDLGRCGVAYANICRELMPQER